MNEEKMGKPDYYELLGIEPGADIKEIKAAYRKMAFQFHPDRNASNNDAAEKMKSVNEAYAVLSDPDKRRQYDELRRQYGNAAYDRFRQSYTDSDIFRGSDVQQIFEEMARAFGLRGVDAIFKEYYGQGYRTFEFQRPGMHARGFYFGGRFKPKPGGNGGGPAFGRQGSLSRGLMGKLLQKALGIQAPKRGDDLHDRIYLNPDFARQGGPYPYLHRERDKRLVVHVPSGIKHGQKIRLAGMGREGRGGGRDGDLFLEASIRGSILSRIKDFLGFKNQ